MVTIVVPVYNVSDYIERCIESVTCQSYKNIECIIVDDATPDDSITKCERIISNNHGNVQFSILHHKQNRGLSAARNTGTDAAIGDYIFYMDGDDEITPDCIEKMLNPVLRDPSIEMVMGSFVREPDGFPLTPRQQQGKRLEEKDLKTREVVRESFFRNEFYANAWNKLIKKNFLLSNQLLFKEGILWEDILWYFYVMKYICHLYTLSDVTYIQHKHPRSITTGISQERKAHYMGLVYEDIANHFTAGEETQEATFLLRDFCIYSVQTSENEMFHRVARQFKKALSDGNHKSELVLLSMTILLSKSVMGRKFYCWALTIRRLMMLRCRPRTH